jgi:pyruvate kinase
MQKSTKIVATIGPATQTAESMEQLILAGMNVARFNTKHGTPEWHAEKMKLMSEVAKKLGMSVGILLDLQGPEIRITIPGEQSFEIHKDEEIVFTSDLSSSDPRQPIIPQIVIDSLMTDNIILIDDGLGEFVVTSTGGGQLRAKALSSFPVSNRKTLNTPGVMVPLPSLIEADLVQLESVKSNGIDVDFVGLSFVRDAKDVEILRSELTNRGLKSAVVAKIENQSAVDNLGEIIDAADAVMVARGDLAVEVPFQELAYWQKLIIRTSREKCKPVITATQMLKSMVTQPRPTRAEVSDVANAIYDGTDAVMLSEETTIGKYPIEAVKTQALIANFNEKYAEPVNLDVMEEDTSSYITHSAVFLLEQSLDPRNNLKIDKIVCLTESGRTARLLSRHRPHVDMHVLTSNHEVYRQLSLLYGVTPHVIELIEEKLESSGELTAKIKELNIAKSGELVLLVHGTFWKLPGLTNTLALVKID